MQSLGDILFKLHQGDGETRVIFLSREKLGKIKQKEQNRLPARVTNVGFADDEEYRMDMSSRVSTAKNI